MIVEEKEGVWINHQGKLIFIGAKDMLLPDDWEFKHFYVVNRLKDDGWMRLRYKEMKTLKEAVKDVYRKLDKPKDFREYSIYMEFKCKSSDYSDRINVLNFVQHRDDDFIKVSSKPFGVRDFKELGIESERDKVVLKSSPNIPNSWKPQKRKNKDNDEEQKLIHNLQAIYGFEGVYYYGNYKKSEKISHLFIIEEYMKTLATFIDFDKIPRKPSLAFSRLKKFGGIYRDSQALIAVKSNGSFYHEYMHFLDYTGYGSNAQDTVDKISKSEDKFFNDLYEDVTLSNYRKQCHRLLDDKGLLKHYTTPAAKRYRYYTSQEEVLARYFSDYMFYYFKDDLSEKSTYHSLSFTNEEIKRHKGNFEQLLGAMGILKVSVNELSELIS